MKMRTCADNSHAWQSKLTPLILAPSPVKLPDREMLAKLPDREMLDTPRSEETGEDGLLQPLTGGRSRSNDTGTIGRLKEGGTPRRVRDDRGPVGESSGVIG